MKRIACALLLIIQISFIGFAQDSPVAVIKGKIKDIKLAEEFIFAESTSLTSPDDAQAAAVDSLHALIISWLTGLGKSKESIDNSWSITKESIQTLKYQNVSLHKTFVYIPKNNVIHGTTAIVANTSTLQVTNQKPKVEEPPLINLDDFDISEEELEQPLSQDINALLALETYQSVIFYLDAMQDDGRLVYGRIATLTSPEQAYLIIVKDGQLITVLDKGKGERMNLRTKQMEDVKNYRGYAIIWLKTFK